LVEAPEDAPARALAAFYVDGFNLYHALLALGDSSQNRHLRWLNLWALAETIINNSEAEVVRVVWCTAENRESNAKMLRHREYTRALKAVDVTPIPGHFATEYPTCKGSCGETYAKETEKAGDVNVAIYLIADGLRDRYDECYLVSADSDQVGTVDMFLQIKELRGKTLTMVAPPGREHSKKILDRKVRRATILRDAIERCLFDKTVLKDGVILAQRPSYYDPLPGWKKPTLVEQKQEKRKAQTIVPETRGAKSVVVGTPAAEDHIASKEIVGFCAATRLFVSCAKTDWAKTRLAQNSLG
jgi:hypothetical protein